MKIYPTLVQSDDVSAVIGRIDWSLTSLGSPAQWPQSLQTSLSIVLNMQVPAFLWWGNDHVQFYNEAYRQLFVNNHFHPAAIGVEARISWARSWPFLHPIINNVFSGVSDTWTEQEFSPDRDRSIVSPDNWKFDASPVIGETGRVNGVLVLCISRKHPLSEYQEAVPAKARTRVRLEKVTEEE